MSLSQCVPARYGRPGTIADRNGLSGWHGRFHLHRRWSASGARCFGASDLLRL